MKGVWLIFATMCTSIFAQETESYSKWLVDALAKESEIAYTIRGVSPYQFSRQLRCENGWVDLTETNLKADSQEITVFHVSDLDPQSIEVVTRDESFVKTLFQVVARTRGLENVISAESGSSKKNRFHLYFELEINAQEFAYALKNLALLSPDKTERPIASVEPGSDFRRLDWGMTKREVIALETAKQIDAGLADDLGYQISIEDVVIELTYSFKEQGLRTVYFSFPDAIYDDYNEYIEFYRVIQNYLTRQYGQPDVDEETWENERYKNQPERRGFAIYLGDLSYKSEWFEKTTRYVLLLMGFQSQPEVIGAALPSSE